MVDWICRLWLRLWSPIVGLLCKLMVPAVNRLSASIVTETRPLPKHKDTLYRHPDLEYNEYRDALFEQSELEYKKLTDKQCQRRMQNIVEVQAIIDNSAEVQHFDGDFPKTYRNGPPVTSHVSDFLYSDHPHQSDGHFGQQKDKSVKKKSKINTRKKK